MMSRRCVLVALLALVSGAGQLVGAQSCQPDCTGKTDGDLVVDPLNCTQFYVCLVDGEPSTQPLACSAGQVFHPTGLMCVPGTECTPSGCMTTSCSFGCNTNKTSQFIPSSHNCSYFHYCDLSGILQGPYSCDPSAPYFNPWTESCSTDNSVCCFDECTPYCPDAFVEVADPANCNMYYLCVAVGPVDPDKHFTCPDGGTFDSSTRECVVGGPCVESCGGGGSVGSCTSSLTCPETGVFPKCDYCTPEHYDCLHSGDPGILHSCPDGQVFNHMAGSYGCVDASLCSPPSRAVKAKPPVTTKMDVPVSTMKNQA